eukprot:8160516-Pyramimonas_sp.AAC.2
MPVVAVVRNMNIIPTNMKMVVLGPSAARPIEDTWPTQAVSTRDIKGSASTAPSAGTANAVICEPVQIIYNSHA